MKTHKIKFLPHGKEIDFAESESVLHAAMEAGVHVNASCGGEGFCGKCRIIIEKGDIEEGISEHLSKEDMRCRLQACLPEPNQKRPDRSRPGRIGNRREYLKQGPPQAYRPNPADEPGRPEEQGSIYTPR